MAVVRPLLENCFPVKGVGGGAAARKGGGDDKRVRKNGRKHQRRRHHRGSKKGVDINYLCLENALLFSPLYDIEPIDSNGSDDWLGDQFESCVLFLLRKARVAARETELTGGAHELLFWTSDTARLIYTIVLCALICGRLWILYAIIPVMTGQVLWILLRWIDFVVDDPQIMYGIEFIKSWIGWGLMQGVHLVNHKDVGRTIFARMFIAMSPKGVEYLKYVLRVRLERTKVSMIHDLEEQQSRYKHAKSFVQRKLQEQKKIQEQAAHTVKTAAKEVVQTIEHEAKDITLRMKQHNKKQVNRWFSNGEKTEHETKPKKEEITHPRNTNNKNNHHHFMPRQRHQQNDIHKAVSSSNVIEEINNTSERMALLIRGNSNDGTQEEKIKHNNPLQRKKIRFRNVVSGNGGAGGGGSNGRGNQTPPNRDETSTSEDYDDEENKLVCSAMLAVVSSLAAEAPAAP